MMEARSGQALRGGGTEGRVLVVEDDQMLRETLGSLLEVSGYEVSLAENGQEALTRLRAGGPKPDVIVLDLRMPIMDGWAFRVIQRDDPALGQIPVVVISADGSSAAAAISAQAYLRKPVSPAELLVAIDRVMSDGSMRLTSLGRLAAGVGHEINNPLTIVMLNLRQSLAALGPSIRALEAPEGVPEPDAAKVRERLVDVAEMLADCQTGSDRIHAAVVGLGRLSPQLQQERVPVDLHALIEESVSAVWDQIWPRARLIKAFETLPSIQGNHRALTQMFAALLLNSAQAMPEDKVEQNEIRIRTWVERGAAPELAVEIKDTGSGIQPEYRAYLFEPFFTTRPVGQGTGLGLAISRQTVIDHGGRLTIESEPMRGTTVRVFLPIGGGAATTPSPPASTPNSAGPVARKGPRRSQG